jgi:flagellar hook protein FlgE
MSQGSLVFTGNPLDVAIEGAGYFTLNDGLGDKYTRVGQFAVDSEYYLVDPTTGYRVQRVGSEGTAEGFQDPTSNDIRIPYDIALPAQETNTISFAGNLSADKNQPTQNLLTSDVKYTLTDGSIASYPSPLADLSQVSGLTDGDQITVVGQLKDGTDITSVYTYHGGGATSETLQFDTGNSFDHLELNDNLFTEDGTGAGTIDITFAGETVNVAIGAGATLRVEDFINAWNGAAANSTATIDALTGDLLLTNNAPGATSNPMAIGTTGCNVQWAGTMSEIAAGDATQTDGLAAKDADTMEDFLAAISKAFRINHEPTSEAKIVNGVIRMEDVDAGYSLSYIDSMTFTDVDSSGSTFELPGQFDIITAGGQFEKPINVEVFDEQGNSYTMAGAFVRTNDVNIWDFVVKSIGGDTQVVDRRCKGIKFQINGSFGEMEGNDTMDVTLAYPSNPGVHKTIKLDMGTLGELDGLTQFGGPSTAATSGQDGYEAGWLSTLSVSREGTLVGVFTNGVRRDVAALKIATFQNSSGLKSIGGNYFEPSANSGDPVPNKATEGGAGVCNGGAIEKSNVEVAEEFVKLIEAQNGYQASARTIKVANEMLQELTNLIR